MVELKIIILGSYVLLDGLLLFLMLCAVRVLRVYALFFKDALPGMQLALAVDTDGSGSAQHSKANGLLRRLGRADSRSRTSIYCYRIALFASIVSIFSAITCQLVNLPRKYTITILSAAAVFDVVLLLWFCLYARDVQKEISTEKHEGSVP